MKLYKFINIYLTAAVALSLAACTAQDPLDEAGNPSIEEMSDVMAKAIFNFAMAPSGEAALASPDKPRVPYSSDNLQHVTDMRIYTFRSNTAIGPYVFIKPFVSNPGETPGYVDYMKVPEFRKDDSNPLWGDDEEEFEKHSHQILPTLKSGYYKFLAVGRDDTKLGVAHEYLYSKVLTENVTTLNDFYYAMKTDRCYSAEVFTGTNPEPLHLSGGIQAFDVDITLYRAVAGVLMYVENVPVKTKNASNTFEDVYAIGIRPAYYNTRVLLNQRTLDEAEGLKANTDSRCIVKYDFSHCYGETDILPQYELNGCFVDFHKAGDAPETDLHKNTVRIGGFITPQAMPGTSIDRTLELVYFNKDGGVIKSRRILLDPETVGKPEMHGGAMATAERYPLVANHFYCIGERNEENDIDEPIDLRETSDDDLILVIGAWQEVLDFEM